MTQEILTIDSKKRITLPENTNIKPNDNILIRIVEQDLLLYKEDNFIRKVDQIKGNYKDSDIETKKVLISKIRRMYSSFIKEVKVDANYRIDLSGIELLSDEFICEIKDEYIKLKSKQKVR